MQLLRIQRPFLVFFLIIHSFISSAAAQCFTEKPEMISLGVTEDLATKQVVSWRAAPENTEGHVELVRDESGPNLEQKSRIIPASTVTKNDYGYNYTYFRAFLDSLESGTRYAYRVVNGTCRSEWFQFKTAESGKKPFSFLYISDVQHGIDSEYPRVIREAALTAPNASFFVFTGDLTGGASDKEFKDFFQAGGWLFASKPIAPIPDNHEYREDKFGNKNGELASFWKNMFAYPANSPDELYEMGTYYFDYQNARFIMINNKDFLENKGKTELYLNWMEQLMKEKDNKWLIVCQHRPVEPVAVHRKRGSFYDLIVPLYEKYGVDLVLTGHDHSYARGGIGLNGESQKEIKGPVYVVSIAGSGMYTPGFTSWYDRMGTDVQLFQHIELNDNTLIYNAYTATGHLYDAFEIEKESQTKRFREIAVDYPEATTLPKKPRKTLSLDELEKAKMMQQEYIRNKADLKRGK